MGETAELVASLSSPSYNSPETASAEIGRYADDRPFPASWYGRNLPEGFAAERIASAAKTGDNLVCEEHDIVLAKNLVPIVVTAWWNDNSAGGGTWLGNKTCNGIRALTKDQLLSSLLTGKGLRPRRIPASFYAQPWGDRR